MASNPNSFDFKDVWEPQYEASHYLAPVYKAIADERQKSYLTVGKNFHRTASGDFIVNDMDGTGSYNPQPWQEVDEELTINYAKEVSIQLKEQDLYMTHLPTFAKKSEKLMNRLFNKIDGTVFSQAYQNAGTILDASALSGQSSDIGKGIGVSQANIPNLFAIANTALIASNINYEVTGKWTGQYKIDKKFQVPVFVMSSQVYSYLSLFVSSKTTDLGDRVSQSGYIGKFFGFNCFVSNALPFSAQLQLPVQPSNGDTITFFNGVTKNILGTVSSQAITFTFNTSLGATTYSTSTGANASVTIGGSAAQALTNLNAAIAAPYTATATFSGFAQATPTTTATSLSVFQQLLFTNITATGVSTNDNFIIEGMGNVPVSAVFTSGSNQWLSTSLIQHCIAGVSNSISLIMPRMAMMVKRPSPQSRVANDHICWAYYGMKVFADQAPGLIDVQVAASGFTTMPNIISN